MEKPPPVPLGTEMTCRRCGTPFSLGHSKQEFCSKACRFAEKRERLGPRVYTEEQLARRKDAHKKWREDHWLSVRERNREWYRSNKERAYAATKRAKAARTPEQKAADKAKSRERYLSRGTASYHATRVWLPWLNSLRGPKQRAKHAGIPFSLTPEWAEARWTGKCEVTGIEFVFSTGRNPYLFSPSLDRIVPERGYVPDNCRFVLHAVNALKGAGTDGDMVRIARAIVDKNP